MFRLNVKQFFEFGKIIKDRADLIKKWADKLDKIKNKVSFAVAMANNHFEGFAPVTANKLRLQMDLEQVNWLDTKQKALRQQQISTSKKGDNHFY